MCVACIEYIKDHLNAAELKGALRETTVDDAEHRQEVERIMREHANNPQDLKRALEILTKTR
jgi:hypothetical protein